MALSNASSFSAINAYKSECEVPDPQFYRATPGNDPKHSLCGQGFCSIELSFPFGDFIDDIKSINYGCGLGVLMIMDGEIAISQVFTSIAMSRW